MGERIDCAAIKTEAGGIVSRPRPGRHSDIIYDMHRRQIPHWDINHAEQGFLTSEGRFVDRVEGLQLASEAGQIIEKIGPDDMLFSEDMW